MQTSFRFIISIIAFGCAVFSAARVNAASVTEVFVPGTNGGPNGYYTIPRIVLQPGDIVTVEGLSGAVDFAAGNHYAAEANGVGDWWYMALTPDGLGRQYWENPYNYLLIYSGEWVEGISDPIRTVGHAGLFLPAQPGTTAQPIGTGSKTFTFAGTSPQFLRLGINDGVWQNNDGQFRARVTIARRSVEFASGSVAFDENAGNALITVSRSDAATAMNVNYATSNGTATAGQDYTAASGTLSFAIGETSRTFIVPITNDSAIESNETVNISLSAPTGGFGVGTLQSMVLTINDNDTTSNNSAFVTQNVPARMYAGEQYEVMVAFKNIGTTTWTAGAYGLSSQNPLDNMTWGINRAFLSTTTAPGETAFVTFNVAAPAVPGIYNFQWKTWQQGVAHFGAFSPTVAVEVIAKPTATVTDAITIEGDSGQKEMVFVVSLSEPMIDQGFVDIATANGTAIAGSDYSAYSPRLIFAEGQNSFTVRINILGDTAIETNETLFLNLSNGFHITIADPQARGVIFDNERAAIADADRDAKSDFWQFRPSDGNWYGLSSRNSNSFFTVHFGQAGDIPVGGDYDGDGYSDFAVWRPSTGVWYVYRTSDGQFTSFQFGISTDIPTQGDFDGDRKTDFAVFRPSSGNWYFRFSGSGYVWSEQFGINGDVPVKADFDGDRRTDVAVFRPSNGTWYVRKSRDSQYLITQFGANADKPVPADYDGDGIDDPAVWRPSTGVWYHLKSSLNHNSFGAFQFGLSNDTPAPGDFDGDGKCDSAVFRPSTGIWYVWQSSSSSMAVRNFGLNGDVPIASRWTQ
ncbi:MAG: hypothetical protein IPK58_02855 [Acidobacteria bacterium]|nr:hypothetical protein [Acidobacteriota bacterium]